MTFLSVRREVGEFKRRYKWMALVVVLTFGVLFARMIQLQLVEHTHYARVARENITRTVRLPATRGIIRDSQGRVLATNRPAYNVYLTPQYLEEGDVGRLAELLGLSVEERTELAARLDGVPARRRAHQIRVFNDITRDQLAAVETHQQDLCARAGTQDRPIRLPCVTVLAEPVRRYPFGRLGAHAIGYLNELTAEELQTMRAQGYRLGDRVGRTGVERSWESYLHGRGGYRRIFVDARGRRVTSPPADPAAPMRREPVPGRDLTLTLDMGLMRIIERAFAGYPSGAAAVVDVETGAVRALYSKPSYDLEEIAEGLTHAEYEALRDDPFRPLIDRSLYESYFPGSTFKPFAALAGLADGAVEDLGKVRCTGSYTLGRTRFGCTTSHGDVDLREGLVESCNVYFYRLAEELGLDPLASLARELGLGRPTGIGINSEADGFIPTRAWYERQGRRYQIGYALNNTIGQGDTRVTVIQLALAYAAIANGGRLHVPQLIERVAGPDGALLGAFAPQVRRRVALDPEHLELVREGLVGVVNASNGTAHEALEDLDAEAPVTMAGKTGTAQVSRRVRRGETAGRAAYLRRAHAWFAGFAPADAPEVAIVVLVEHGGPGGRYAAPIAIRILQEYLASPSTETAAVIGRRPPRSRRN
ncbi:MAG: penicillin-binding protein 2 [Sandaracinaceae bacterium]